MNISFAICSTRLTKRETSSSQPAGGSGGFTTNPLPAGSASISSADLRWTADANATGYLVFLSTAPQDYPDPALFTYSYYVAGQASESLAIASIQAGTYYYRVAAAQTDVYGDLGTEYQVVAS